MTTSLGSVGLYPAKDGTIFATFRAGDAGMPLEDLLPASGRGEGFEDFPVADYFDYAHLWFATAAQIEALNKHVRDADLLPGQTTKVARVPIDLKAYKLLCRGGAIDNEQLKEMFLAIAMLWEQAKPVAPIPALFHGLYRQGMPPRKIAASLLWAHQSGDVVNGALDLERIKADPMYQITEVAFLVYAEHQGLGTQKAYKQSDIDAFKTLWRRWTRRDGDTVPETRDAYLVWQDYRRLRLIDAQGNANTANARLLAQHICERADAKPDFDALAVWAEDQFEQQVTAQAVQSKTSQKTLRKRRKLGRMNKKRGRR